MNNVNQPCINTHTLLTENRENKQMPRTKIGHKWNVVINFRGDAVMVDQIERLAAREGVTKSALLRELVNDGIRIRNSAEWRDRLFD